MFRSTVIIAGVVLGFVLGAAPAGAGDYKKCPLDAQTCLNKMVAKLKKSGWLGIEYAEDTKAGLKLTRVVPGSPAEEAGLQRGDVIISVDGAKYADNTPERCVTCEKTKDRWVPGQNFEYLVSRNGKPIRMRIELAALPSDVMASMIGMHMLEHAQVADNPP